MARGSKLVRELERKKKKILYTAGLWRKSKYELFCYFCYEVCVYVRLCVWVCECVLVCARAWVLVYTFYKWLRTQSVDFRAHTYRKQKRNINGKNTAITTLLFLNTAPQTDFDNQYTPTMNRWSFSWAGNHRNVGAIRRITNTGKWIFLNRERNNSHF